MSSRDSGIAPWTTPGTIVAVSGTTTGESQSRHEAVSGQRSAEGSSPVSPKIKLANIHSEPIQIRNEKLDIYRGSLQSVRVVGDLDQ